MKVNLPVNILPVTYLQNHSQSMYPPDDLPKTVARTLNQGSTPMSMDFHPTQQTVLLGELLFCHDTQPDRHILENLLFSVSTSDVF